MAHYRFHTSIYMEICIVRFLDITVQILRLGAMHGGVVAFVIPELYLTIDLQLADGRIVTR